MARSLFGNGGEFEGLRDGYHLLWLALRHFRNGVAQIGFVGNVISLKNTFGFCVP
jgi:hypothetical protein